MLTDGGSTGVAAVFTALGVVISIYQILCHLRNYTEPVFQRYIIRIIFMVPVYAVGSFASLQWRDGAIYFDTLRDCYEAWIIYNFSSLLLAYVGGPGAVVVKAEGRVVHPSWTHMTCCLPPMQVDGFFLRRCKQGTLQFVLLKPVMAALTLILYAAGAYTDGDMSPKNGYFYISVLYNVCYTLALYGLILFWVGAAELLQPFNPLLKFVLVKTVVFLTFWQGIAISAVNSMGGLTDPEEGKALQNFLICVEMAVAGAALLKAFPHAEYAIGGSAAGWRREAFVHAISVRDVVADTVHVFAPSYSDYVLYSDGGPADNVKRKKFRGQKGAEHPKASLLRNMARGGDGGGGGGKAAMVLAAGVAAAGGGGSSNDRDEEEGGGGGGRRSKTPAAGGGGGSNKKQLDAQRNQAILLDSDSDGIDSDDEGEQLGEQREGGGDNGARGMAALGDGDDGEDCGSDDDGSVGGGGGGGGGAGSDGDREEGGSRRQQQRQRRPKRSRSRIRAHRGAGGGGPGGASMLPAGSASSSPEPLRSAAASPAVLIAAPMQQHQQLLRWPPRGPILSDSDTEEPPPQPQLPSPLLQQQKQALVGNAAGGGKQQQRPVLVPVLLAPPPPAAQPLPSPPPQQGESFPPRSQQQKQQHQQPRRSASMRRMLSGRGSGGGGWADDAGGWSSVPLTE